MESDDPLPSKDEIAKLFAEWREDYAARRGEEYDRKLNEMARRGPKRPERERGEER